MQTECAFSVVDNDKRILLPQLNPDTSEWASLVFQKLRGWGGESAVIPTQCGGIDRTFKSYYKSGLELNLAVQGQF